MSFRSIVRDVRDSFGNISRRGFEAFLSGHTRGNPHGSGREPYDSRSLVPYGFWANLPPELLLDIIRRLEESESTWPSRKHLVACASVCRTWREMCKEVVRSPEFSGKLTFPISLKQPGPRDGTIQCFIRRDESNSVYHLDLCLSPDLLNKNGKFLLSAKRIRRTTCTEYIISTDSGNISRSSKSYIGKLRSNFLGTKFLIYDIQPPCSGTGLSTPGQRRRRFYSKKVSPRIPSGNYNIAQITYELNVLGTRCPRRMNCIMYSIPASSLDTGGSVPSQPENLFSRTLEDSFRSMSFSHSSMSFSHSSIMDRGSMDFSSCRFSNSIGRAIDDDNEVGKKEPLVLQNKAPRWHEQLQCWCLNFRGRVTVASVKNFQLVAATQPSTGAPTPAQHAIPDQDKIILQFGRVGKDIFTMDFSYPLSAFQAFAICLSSFDTKLARE